VPYLITIFDRLRVANGRLLVALSQLNELQPETKHRHQEIFASMRTSISVLIEPDTEEMHQQPLIKRQLIRFYPFHFGRRTQLADAKAMMQNHLLVVDRSLCRASRKHCIIHTSADGVFVVDKTSKLGTIVNSIPIGGKSRETRVKLILGTNTLVLGCEDS
jgi:ribulose kinase